MGISLTQSRRKRIPRRRFAARRLNARGVVRISRAPVSAEKRLVRRPVWRSFRPEFLARAVLHVKDGGFAAVIWKNGKMKMLLPLERDGSLTEMARWALLSLEIRRWGRARTGPLRKLAAVHVKPDDRAYVREWCERDSVHPRSTHGVRLDCRACGACCRDNRVVLEPPDFAMWKRRERADLLGRRYVRASKGSKLLRLTAKGSCVHLGPSNRCAIYRLRPGNCRAFPVGAETCLAARLDTLGIVD
jgi:hypothetical protein